MTQSIRRSLRARRPTFFITGDIVELKTPGGEVCVGELTYKLSEEDDVRESRWIVTLSGSDDYPRKNLELKEKDILRLINRRKNSLVSTDFVIGKNKRKQGQHKLRNVVSGVSDKNKNIEEKESSLCKEKEEGTSKLSSAYITVVNEEPQSKPEISERERRRIRREALLGEDRGRHSDGSSTLPPKNKCKTSLASPNQSRSNRVTKNKNKKYKKSRKNTGEECIKVKLNTGTLYLYRGLNRRAVFTRKY